MSRILLTGGAGFIGSHLTEFLLKETNYNITILDRLDSTVMPERLSRHSRVKFVWWDLKAEINESVRSQLNDIDTVAHLAASSHVDRSIKDPMLFVLDNVVGTCSILNWIHHVLATESRYIHLLHISTDEVFGSALNFHYAYKNTDTLAPENIYAATKEGAEALVRAYACTYRTPFRIARLTNIIGPRQHHEKFIPKTIENILKDNIVEIHSDKQAETSGTRYYLDVRDLCRALLLLLQDHSLPNLYKENRYEGIYHISGDKEISNLYVAKKLASLLKLPLKYKYTPYAIDRPYHDMSYRIDDTRMRLLGWKPEYSIDESLEYIITSLKV